MSDKNSYNLMVFLGLKGKVILLVASLLAILSGLMSLVVVDKTREAMQTEIQEKGVAIAKNLAYNSVYGVIVEDVDVLNQFIAGIIGELDIGYVIIMDTQRKILAHSLEAMTGTVLNNEVTMKAFASDKEEVQDYAEAGRYYYDISTPIFNKSDGEKLGVVRIGVDKTGMDKKIAGIIRLSLGISITLLSLGIVISVYVVNLIIQPLKQMGEVSQKIADGDFTQEITVRSGDEVGMLGSAFLKMMQNLKMVLMHIKGVSVSLTDASEEILVNAGKVQDGARIQASSAEQTAASVEEMNASIREISNNIELLSTASEASSSSVLEMSASISEVASNSNNLSQAVEDTTSSITQISASIKQVAENVEILSVASNDTNKAVAVVNTALTDIGERAKDSTRLSKKVVSDAKEYGIKSIKKTIKGMENIKDTISSATEVINRLGERSKRIGKILTVIDEVTKQTNLLALNAAILAAQAGEQGKGFAVVADEIKNLADRTDASTKEIAGLITDVQNETSDAINSINKGAISVEEGMLISLEAGDALEKILVSSEQSTEMSVAIERSTAVQVKEIATVAETIGRVSSMAGQITKATHDQRKGATQIMMTSEKMRDIAKHVSKTTEEQARTSQQINVAVENVTSRVGQIASSIREQKKGSDIIMSSIRNINNVSQESVKLSLNMSTAVGILTRQAENLKSEINKFKVE